MPNHNIIFTRPPRPSKWNPRELAGPYEPLTLREWEVSVLTCNQAPAHCALLRQYLLLPATPTCRRVAPWLPGLALPFPVGPLRRSSLIWKREQLQRTLAALWQTLDAPPYAFTGMARALALVLLSIRLHQLLDAFPGTIGALTSPQELREALSALGFQVESARPPAVNVRRERPAWWRRWARARAVA